MKNKLTVQEVLDFNWKKNPKPLCGHGGVYRIVERKTGELLYIGQSKDLGDRLAPSHHHIFKRGRHDLYVLFEDDLAERCQMEMRFIRMFRPKYNQHIGWEPTISDDELTRQYHKIFG